MHEFTYEDYEPLPSDHARLAREKSWNSWLLVTPFQATCGLEADEVLYESNQYAVENEFEMYHLDWHVQCNSIAVPLYRDDDPRKGYTREAYVALNLLARLENYPVLDEEDYWSREMSAWERYATEYLEGEFEGKYGRAPSAEECERLREYTLEHTVGNYSLGDVPSDADDEALAYALTGRYA